MILRKQVLCIILEGEYRWGFNLTELLWAPSFSVLSLVESIVQQFFSRPIDFHVAMNETRGKSPPCFTQLYSFH